jgi:hypothetical protein
LRQLKVKKASLSQPFVTFSMSASSAKAAEFATGVQQILWRIYALTPFLTSEPYLFILNLALDLIVEKTVKTKLQPSDCFSGAYFLDSIARHRSR